VFQSDFSLHRQYLRTHLEEERFLEAHGFRGVIRGICPVVSGPVKRQSILQKGVWWQAGSRERGRDR
jgi:hypothetical protein